jgi:hypothetical protein
MYFTAPPGDGVPGLSGGSWRPGKGRGRVGLAPG